MNETPAPKPPPQRRLWPRLLAGTTLAAVLTLWLLPVGMEVGLERWLRDNGAASAKIGDIDFNPFSGELVVKGFDARAEDGRTLSAARASLALDWWPLWQQRVKVRGVALAGAVVEVEVATDGTVGIGPLAFGGEEAERPAEPPPAGEGTAWEWAIREVTLKNVHLHFSDPRLKEDAVVDHLRLTGLASWQPEAESTFEAALKLGGGDMKISGRALPFAATRSAAIRIDATALALDRLRPLLSEETVEGLEGRLDLATDVSAELADDGSLQASVKGTLQGDGIALELPDTGQRLRQEQLHLQGNVQLKTGDETYVATEATVEGSGLTIDDLRRGRNAATIDRLNLGKVRFEAGILSASELSLGGIKLLQRPAGANGGSHALTLAGLDLDRVEVAPGKRIEIGRVALNGGDLILARDAKGLELQPWLEPPPDAGPAAPKPPPEAAEPTALSLERVTLEDCRLGFLDGTLAPPYSESIESLAVELREVDSRTPEHPSPLQVKARIGRYANLSAAGTVRPFAAKPTLRLKGQVEGFDLPSLNPYTVSLLDYRLNKGHLDTFFKGGVDNGIIDAEVRLTAGKLEVEQLQEGEKNRFRRLIGMPVTYALTLLRDRQDNIQIKIPIAGDLSDPKLRIADLLTQAVRSGLQRAAVSYYAPLGVTLLTGVVLPPGTLFVAGKAVEWVTTMRFQPVLFEAGDSAFGDEGGAYLDKTAELIKDRPKVRLVLCGRAAAADLARLRGKAPEETPAPASEEERRQLTELAQSRSHAVKDHLIDRGIAADRLLICVPEVKLDGQVVPMVEISG